MITYTVEVVEKPSHSKGWMAYTVPGVIEQGGNREKLNYGTVSTQVDGPLRVTFVGEVKRATRREKIREERVVELLPGQTTEIRRDISNSNRLALRVSAS